MSTYNKVLILGTLGVDPVLKGTKTGKPFCRLSLATDGIPSRETGETRTSWHSIHVFGKLAEIAAQHLTKGRQVLVEGRLDTTATEDQGRKVWRTWITADKLTFVGPHGKNEVETRPLLADDTTIGEIPEFGSTSSALG